MQSNNRMGRSNSAVFINLMAKWLVLGLALGSSAVLAESSRSQAAVHSEFVVRGTVAEEITRSMKEFGVPVHVPTHSQRNVMVVDLLCKASPSLHGTSCIFKDRFVDGDAPVGLEPIDVSGEVADDFVNLLEMAGVQGFLPPHAQSKVWQYDVVCEEGAAQEAVCRFQSSRHFVNNQIDFARKSLAIACAIWGCTEDEVEVSCPDQTPTGLQEVQCAVMASELQELVMTLRFASNGEPLTANSTIVGPARGEKSLDEANRYTKQLACGVWGSSCNIDQVQESCSKLEFDESYVYLCAVEHRDDRSLTPHAQRPRMIVQLASDLRFIALEMEPVQD